MVFKSIELIEELKEYVKNHISFVKSLQDISEEKLQIKLNEASWSVVECIEHLNLYSVFYNPEIKSKIKKTNTKGQKVFKSGYLGNKFSLDMLPKEGMKTMSAFKSKNPIHSKLNSVDVLGRFISYQEELLELLDLALNVDLNKVKTSITLPLLKFKLGDTLRFVIYHNERHIVQAKRILSKN